jgi:hypothetical protein
MLLPTLRLKPISCQTILQKLFNIEAWIGPDDPYRKLNPVLNSVFFLDFQPIAY